MNTKQQTILFAGLLASMALLASTTLGYAAVITCTDTNLTYADSCPSPGTSGRCINPLSLPNGCCNKGTCNNDVCVTGPDQDALCLNDGNDCTDDSCSQDANHQAQCTHANSPTTKDCNRDSDVCTLDKCDGAGSCASTGNVNTCAAEQASNPAEQPICAPWKCNATTGCAKTAVLNSPVVQCDDGKDCTTGDHCIDGVCGKGSSGTVLQNNEPCRDDDTHLNNPDDRTWCRHGICSNDGDEACDHVVTEPANGACHPNPCTNGTCDTRGGTCTITSCNVGQSVTCEPCGTTLNCVNYGVGQNGNYPNACGCLSTFQ